MLAKSIVHVALGTAMRRGELVGPRWRSVNLLETKIEIRETFVRGRFTTPKSRASRRVVELGPRTLAVLEEQWQHTAYRGDEDLVFGHPTKGTPVDTTKLAKRYLKPALARAGIEKPFRPFHDLRHSDTCTPARCSSRARPRRAKRGCSDVGPRRPSGHALIIRGGGLLGSDSQRRCCLSLLDDIGCRD